MTFPVPLQTGHLEVTLESPTTPVPRQLLQSVWIAGPGFLSVISAYRPETATNGRRSSAALEQPESVIASTTRIVLYISHRPVCGVFSARPAGNAGEGDALAAVDRVGECPEAAVRDFKISAEHLATS